MKEITTTETPKTIQEGSFKGFEVISTYTRDQAIEDGTLIDISQSNEAKEAGFQIPICLTRNVWAKLVDVPESVKGEQDEKGRLWDLCYMSARMFKQCMNNCKRKGDPVDACSLVKFKVAVRNTPRKLITPDLWLVFNSSEGFTLMFPEDY